MIFGCTVQTFKKHFLKLIAKGPKMVKSQNRGGVEDLEKRTASAGGICNILLQYSIRMHRILDIWPNVWLNTKISSKISCDNNFCY
jgi:hypothetical protein